MSSVVRPLAVARGGHYKLDREPGKEHSDDQMCQFRHQPPRCVVGWESGKQRDASSEKATRCVVGPQLIMQNGSYLAQRHRPRSQGCRCGTLGTGNKTCETPPVHRRDRHLGAVPPEERRSMSAITEQRSQQLLVSFAKTVRVGYLRLNFRCVMGRTNQRVSASEIGGR